jgi:hypothetical protein
MKRFGVRFVIVVAVVVFTCFVSAHPFGTAQEQEDLSNKTLPKQKVAPKQEVQPKADSLPQFVIGGFTVTVAPPSASSRGRVAEPGARSQVSAPVAKGESGYSGQGHIDLKGQRIPVSFTGIGVARRTPGQVPVATAGVVTGIAGPAVEYDLTGFKIKLERKSIRLTPESATAAATLSLIKAPFMAPGQDHGLSLSSESCGIAPDGSVDGQNFRGPSSFLPRGSIYRLEVAPDTNQAVHLGPNVPAPKGRPKPPKGCVLRGTALFDGTKLFSFQGTIDASGKSADFALVLLPDPPVRSPEPGYELALHSGTVSYRYASNGALVCEGEFNADIKFPPAVKRFDSQGLELRNLTFKTDETGALFNTITLPEQLRAGFAAGVQPANAIFLIDPSPGAAWVYFPKWQTPAPNSSYPMLKSYQKITDVTPDCGALIQFLETPAAGGQVPRNAPLKNVLRRPGVTVLKGTLYFKSRQTAFKPAPPAQPAQTPAAEFNLKTLFWGGLTLTPWGITGTLTSSGSSFVSSANPIEDCARPSGVSRPTWAEILDAGAGKPAEPAERFRLAGLRILEMRVESMLLCRNELPKNGAAMRYIVHFPFPSFIDLDFADASLDARGLFASAEGPVGSKSWAFAQNPTRADIDAALAGQLKKGAQEKLNPDTHILWEWRLPVSFSDRGVIITYPGAAGTAGVNVTMKPYDPNVPEIMSSEIWLRPLFSRNSGIKAGVRFAAKLDPDGGFQLTGWDTALLTFAKLYAAPGTEQKVGFDCRLNAVSAGGIILADTASNPATRPSDAQWSGSLTFPFFKEHSVGFQVRNLIPDMPAPIVEMSASGVQASTCQVDPTDVNKLTENPGQDPNQTLRATIKNLRYSRTSYPFQSREATAVKNGTESRAEVAYFSSFTCGEMRLAAAGGNQPVVIPLHSTTDNCGGAKAARHVLLNPISGRDIVDLVCYDAAAYAARGLTDACCKDYWLGTYQVSTGSAGSEKVIFTAPNAKWYPQVTPVQLFFNSSDAVLSSDEMDNPHKTFINIPGAGLKQDEHGALVGAFGATLTSLASSLPYEGEFRFYLDPNCGYFYLLSGGSFTYFLRFSGEVFVVNAPYKLLKRPPDFIGETQLIETLSIRALFPGPRDFADKTGLSRLSDNTVISGVFQAGNAAFSYGVNVLSVNVAAGAGTYLFQYKSSAGTSYSFGTFQNARAAASVILASAEADMSLAQGPVTTGSLAGLEDFFGRAELTASGTLVLCACVDLWLAHLQAIARGDATFSTRTGLSFSGSAKADVGSGGCSPCR